MTKLNLGCSNRHLPGYVNVDLSPPADLVVDLSLEHSRRTMVTDLLMRGWDTWEDSSIESIVAHDIIEHLPDKILTMNQIWRVLAPGGQVDIVVPTTDGAGAWQDPGHVSYWNRNSFWYYTHGDAHRERFGDSYGIRARFKVLSEKMMRGQGIYEGIVHLHIVLEAVK